jgi:hypothetical protein
MRSNILFSTVMKKIVLYIAYEIQTKHYSSQQLITIRHKFSNVYSDVSYKVNS